MELEDDEDIRRSWHNRVEVAAEAAAAAAGLGLRRNLIEGNPEQRKRNLVEEPDRLLMAHNLKADRRARYIGFLLSFSSSWSPANPI